MPYAIFIDGPLRGQKKFFKRIPEKYKSFKVYPRKLNDPIDKIFMTEIIYTSYPFIEDKECFKWWLFAINDKKYALNWFKNYISKIKYGDPIF